MNDSVIEKKYRLLKKGGNGFYDCMHKSFISPKKAIGSYRNTPYSSKVTAEEFKIIEETHIITEKELDISIFL